MASFQKITIGIAVILLIMCLIFIGYSLYNSKYNTAYPPVAADCPDYWLDKEGDCVNVKELGSDSCKRNKNFNTSFWTGDEGLCRKKQWARKCNLTWDGVTNNQNACKSDDDN
tara:strand:+ start:742 stop:1080 length:339 start_codon:yes stop_codon:yes gene_type:complete